MNDPSTDRVHRIVAVASAGVAAVAGSFAVAGPTPEFVAAPLVSLLVDASPGAVTTAGITTLGDLALPLVGAFGLLVTVTLFAAVALGADGIGGRSDVPYTAAVVAAVASLIVALALTSAATSSLATAGAVALTLVIAERRWGVGRGAAVSGDRRSVLKAVGAVGTFGVVAYLVGRDGGGDTDRQTTVALAEIADEETVAEAESMLERAREQSLPVPGMDSLVTDVGAFYEVDVNVTNPDLSAARYTLDVTGRVAQERTYRYEDLLSMPLENRYETLRCVGDSINGKKMDTAVWTGVPIGRLLDEAGARDDCCVMLHAADGYYEEFPLEALRDGFLAVGMNGEVLPRGHGYPVRALVPGHWGEINVKWVTKIEVLPVEREGYWEKRGWHGTGPVNTVAKLHAVNELDDGRVQVGGHAYAGTRGVSRVEVSVDGGETWVDATLSEPLPDPDTWRMWEHVYEPDGDHEVVVRAVDGTGAVQPRDQQGAFPSGATGWVSKDVSV
jgi:DMSO/TMAO reductase YedYZ molybdopterin-dependent catalytic subunit